ncbi:unnamed protein product [Meganyctiphanes norvegica]|uniref:Uncharacterized protein n=1 Tax=Meganyctiphanes norvegica TaxID=48144 RepID=A0AAV2PVC9_MEGNR
MKVQLIQKCTFLSILVTVSTQNHSDAAIVIVSSSKEATLDTPIWFSAKYQDYQKGEEVNYFWKDDLWTFQRVIISNGSSNWSIIYDSKIYSDYTGARRVTVSAYGSNITELVTASFDFILRDTLVGDTLTYQKNVTIPSPNFISTGNQTNLTALVHDPEDWLKFRTKKAHFLWYISSIPGVLPDVKIHADCSTPSLLLNLTDPGTYTIYVIVSLSLYNISNDTSYRYASKTDDVSYIPSARAPGIKSPSEETALPTEFVNSFLHHSTHPTHPPPNAHNWTCDGWWPISYMHKDYFFKVGFFHNVTTARDPIDSVTVNGDTWINNGDILKLNISCSGSGPWYSCNKTVVTNYNITGNETCNGENLIAETNFDECRFNLSHYFKNDGSYTYLLMIYNDVSIMRRNITINIYRGKISLT